MKKIESVYQIEAIKFTRSANTKEKLIRKIANKINSLPDKMGSFSAIVVMPVVTRVKD